MNASRSVALPELFTKYASSVTATRRSFGRWTRAASPSPTSIEMRSALISAASIVRRARRELIVTVVGSRNHPQITQIKHLNRITPSHSNGTKRGPWRWRFLIPSLPLRVLTRTCGGRLY